jgi:predicted transposase YdaD
VILIQISVKHIRKKLFNLECGLDLVFINKIRKRGRKKRRKEGKKEGREERRNVNVSYISLLIIFIECSGSPVPKQTGPS